MQLFYHPEVTHLTKQFVFEKEESRHIAKVLRKKEGDRLHLTNGKGYFFTVELLSSMPKQCVAEVLNCRKTVSATLFTAFGGCSNKIE